MGAFLPTRSNAPVAPYQIVRPEEWSQRRRCVDILLGCRKENYDV